MEQPRRQNDGQLKLVRFHHWLCQDCHSRYLYIIAMVIEMRTTHVLRSMKSSYQGQSSYVCLWILYFFVDKSFWLYQSKFKYAYSLKQQFTSRNIDQKTFMYLNKDFYEMYDLACCICKSNCLKMVLLRLQFIFIFLL